MVIFYLLATFFPGFDFTFAEDEMRDTLATELDFVHEADNAERAAKHLTIPHVYIPRVYRDISSRRILTCEFIHGCKINQTQAMEEMGLRVDRVAHDMLQAFAEQIFVAGFIHADPHPGNVLVRPDPQKGAPQHQVVLIDHGLYRELGEPLRLSWCRLWKAMIEKDTPAIEEAVSQLNVDPSCADTMVQMVLMRAHNDSTRVGLGSGMTEEEIRQMTGE